MEYIGYASVFLVVACCVVLFVSTFVVFFWSKKVPRAGKVHVAWMLGVSLVAPAVLIFGSSALNLSPGWSFVAFVLAILCAIFGAARAGGPAADLFVDESLAFLRRRYFPVYRPNAVIVLKPGPNMRPVSAEEFGERLGPIT